MKRKLELLASISSNTSLCNKESSVYCVDLFGISFSSSLRDLVFIEGNCCLS